MRELERRADARTAYTGWVEITSGGWRRLATGHDLSAGGIGVAARDLPGDVRRVTAEFALPGISLPLALEARLSWRDDGGGRLGLAFERVDPGLLELLENYVAGRL